MVKAKMNADNGQPIILLGLSDKNIQMLKDNKPIIVDLKSMLGPDCKVVIFWGATEETMQDDLMKRFNVSQTIDKRGPSRKS